MNSDEFGLRKNLATRIRLNFKGNCLVIFVANYVHVLISTTYSVRVTYMNKKNKKLNELQELNTVKNI